VEEVHRQRGVDRERGEKLPDVTPERGGWSKEEVGRDRQYDFPAKQRLRNGESADGGRALLLVEVERVPHRAQHDPGEVDPVGIEPLDVLLEEGSFEAAPDVPAKLVVRWEREPRLVADQGPSPLLAGVERRPKPCVVQGDGEWQPNHEKDGADEGEVSHDLQ